MRIFRNYIYRVAKPDTPGGILERTLHALKGDGLADATLLYRFEDMAFGRVSGTSRIRKKYPDLPAILEVQNHQDDLSTRTQSVLRNGSHAVTASSPDATTIVEVMKGVPRSYPLSTAEVIITNLKWERCGFFSASTEPLTAGGIRLGAIAIVTSWWINQRENSFTASLEIPISSHGSLCEPPERVESLLNAFGRVRTRELHIEPSPEERLELAQSERAAADLMRRYDDGLLEIAKALPFPHALPHPYTAETEFATEPVGTYKAALKTVFAPLGYTYRSDQSRTGFFVLTKRSDLGHVLELSFDIGSYSKSYSGMLSITGPGWGGRAILPVTAWESCAAYPIVNGQVWQLLLENVRTAVQYYESTFIKEIEVIFGPPPGWFAAWAGA